MEKPSKVTIAGHPLQCPHCQHNTFFERSWQLNTSGMTFLNLDWLNSSATNYVCSRCGRIEWFTDPGGKEHAAHLDDGDTECLECGASMPHGTSACPKCGWTYK
jgi:DNA-directed RNA polymerase subunit RPC12/RpoP